MRLRADYISAVLATMHFRIFCLPVCYLKPLRLKYINALFYLLFYIAVNQYDIDERT